jgi:CTP synthase (UTP-ammonia lyase)
MNESLRIGIIGDFNPASRYHLATDDSIRHAAGFLGLTAEITWLPTPQLEGAHTAADLDAFDGLWCSPGSPYESMQGALDGIRWARERGKPFIGT